MLGRFLEISLHTPEILDSIAFWEALGFRQVATNDVWTHPYTVVSDGRAMLGLHQYAFDSPALTFVRPDLAGHLEALRAAGAEFEFAKTADDQFHEAGFLSPDGLMMTLLESRTCSPPAFDEHGFSLCGEFEGLMLPVRRVDVTLPFFARLGFAVLEFDEAKPDTARLTNGPLTLLLDEAAGLKAPTLVFRSDDLEATAAAIARRVADLEATGDGALTLTAPEGLTILIQT